VDQALALGCVLPAAVGAGCCVLSPYMAAGRAGPRSAAGGAGPRLAARDGTGERPAARRPGRRARDLAVGAAMVVMVLGMTDTMLLGGAVLPALAWAAVYAALAGGLCATRGVDAATRGVTAEARGGAAATGATNSRASARVRYGPRAAHLAAMAVVTTAIPSAHAHGIPAGRPGAGTALLTASLAASAAYTAYAVWLATGKDGWARAELTAAGLSTLAMGGMIAIG